MFSFKALSVKAHTQFNLRFADSLRHKFHNIQGWYSYRDNYV